MPTLLDEGTEHNGAIFVQGELVHACTLHAYMYSKMHCGSEPGQSLAIVAVMIMLQPEPSLIFSTCKVSKAGAL